VVGVVEVNLSDQVPAMVEMVAYPAAGVAGVAEASTEHLAEPEVVEVVVKYGSLRLSEL
jgi:hypothetical protein